MKVLFLTAALVLAMPAFADCVIRQSDALELALGPYVDATDGITAETGLTISQGDVILKKCAAAGDCGASAQKNDSSACAHDANGMYECDFNTTDTDTVGILEIWSFESGAAPVFKTCEVVETAIYDDLYADGALGLAKAAALTTVDDFVDTEIATLQTSVTAVDDFVDTEIADIRRAIGPATTTIAARTDEDTFTLTAGSADDNAYNGYVLVTIDQSTAAQSELGCVTDYTGSTKSVQLRADPGIFTIAAGDFVVLLPAFCDLGVDVATIETVDATDQLDAHAAAGLDAAGVRAAVGLASANMDTQFAGIESGVDIDTVEGSDATNQIRDALVDDAQRIDASALNTLSGHDPGEAIMGATDLGTGAGLTTLATAVNLATANTNINTIDDFVDTEVAAIKAKTDNLPSDPADASDVAAAVAVTNGKVDAVDDFVDTEVAALLAARTQLFPGGSDSDSILTADSGDTNTLVDTELTFSSANDIDGAYVVRSDGQRCFIDSFNPTTDTIEFNTCAFTGAWSTQTYKIYPANTQ